MENEVQQVRPFGRVVASESFERNPKDTLMSLPTGVPIFDPPDMAGIGLM